jgi:hypothetical protein
MAYGRYALDMSALDFEKFDKKQIKIISEKYPPATTNILKKYGYL